MVTHVTPSPGRRTVRETTPTPSAGPVGPARADALEGGAAAAGTPARTIELAKATLVRLGKPASTEEAKAALKDDAHLRATVRLHAWSTSADADEQAALHYVINTDAQLAAAAPTTRAQLEDVSDRLVRYARHYGYKDVVLEGTVLTLRTVDGTKVPAGEIAANDVRSLPPDLLLRKLGRLVNQQRVGCEKAVPPFVPMEPRAQEFSAANGLATGHLSWLAYHTPQELEEQLGRWGYDLSTFTFVEDEATHTQGFVVADRQRSVHVVFRGSESRTDVRTDLMAALVKTRWAPNKVKVHAGCSAALEAVWPQVEDAMKRARDKVGRDAPVFFSGHSLGGAIAQLAAAKSASLGLTDIDQGIGHTFGANRVGNRAFKRLVESVVPRMFRVVHRQVQRFGRDNDPVTDLPPRFFGYDHGGHLVQISADGVQVTRADGRASGSPLAMRLTHDAAVDDVDDETTTDDVDGGDEDKAALGAAVPPSVLADVPPRALQAVRTAGAGAALAAADGAALALANIDDATIASQTSRASTYMGFILHLLGGYLEDLGAEMTRKLR